MCVGGGREGSCWCQGSKVRMGGLVEDLRETIMAHATTGDSQDLQNHLNAQHSRF